MDEDVRLMSGSEECGMIDGRDALAMETGKKAASRDSSGVFTSLGHLHWASRDIRQLDLVRRARDAACPSCLPNGFCPVEEFETTVSWMPNLMFRFAAEISGRAGIAAKDQKRGCAERRPLLPRYRDYWSAC